MAASSSSSPFVPLLLLFLAVGIEMRPSPKRDEAEVLNSLFDTRLSSLILASPSSGDIAEVSAGPSFISRGSTASRAPMRGLTGRQEAVTQFFLDFLQRHAKVRRRSRNRHSVMGGRGCFGMKMDRIGAISGLGC